MKKKLDKEAIVVCDKCKAEFLFKKANLKEVSLRQYVKEQGIQVVDALPKDITITYFTCPECKKQYVVILKNEETRKLLDEITKYQKQIRTMMRNKAKNPTLMQLIYDKCATMQEQVAEIGKSLKKDYEEIL